jgi:hypothetical protein
MRDPAGRLFGRAFFLTASVALAACGPTDSPAPAGSAQGATSVSVSAPPGIVSHGGASTTTAASASAGADVPSPEKPELPDDATSYAKVGRVDPAPGPAPAGGFAGAADKCLSDATCPMDRYAGLLVAAVDAGEAGVSCAQLIRGVGVAKDLPRARACSAKAVEREGDCGKSSPSLDRLELALLMTLGQGGPQTSADARRTLEGCFDDGSVMAVLGIIEGQEKGKPPALDSIDVCRAGLAITTLHMVSCQQIELKLGDVRENALRKALLGRFDAKWLAAYDAASKDHAKYAATLADAASDLFRNGTLATVQHPSTLIFASERRRRRWEELLRDGKPTLPAADEARKKVLAERDAAPERGQADAGWKKLVKENEKAYAPYRAKEAALLKSMPKLGADEVQALLDVERTDELGLFSYE